MEHMIEHETLPLKEEKQLIREIKQLKQLRDQISSNIGRQDDVQQALDQKDQIEERLKVNFRFLFIIMLNTEIIYLFIGLLLFNLTCYVKRWT